MKLDIKMLQAGEQGLVVEFGKTIDQTVNYKVACLTKLLKDRQLAGIIEIVPTYRSLLVYFQPLIVSRKNLEVEILDLLPQIELCLSHQQALIIHIPVCYSSEEFAPDIAEVARQHNLSIAEVIKIHTQPNYLIYMLGFMAGFPYLGGLSEQIATPRLTTPRTLIPRGSVGIADTQTGIYPVESPGGWQLIGRTPLLVYNSLLNNPFLFKAGDYLHFEAISEQEYLAIEKSVAAGSYKTRYSTLGGE